MTSRARGLYEELITAALAAALDRLDPTLLARSDRLHPVEAPDRLALHLGRVLRRVLEHVEESKRIEVALTTVRSALGAIAAHVDGIDPAADVPLGDVLRSIALRRPDGRAEEIHAPLIPLLDTTLLTNAPGEPTVGSQVAAEIRSADAIDVVMAFIRFSGVMPLLGELRSHCAAGRRLRVLTTIYTGSTEARALDELQALGAEVRVSYDTRSTRLHAKSWLFHRASGFSTAYIGSSNLTHSAQVTGLEWNVRASAARNREVVDKVAAVFATYWESGDFVPYDRAEFERARKMPAASRHLLLSPIELRLEPFQERLLEQVGIARAEGVHRNLIVAATGTGKTVMAAVDYARLRAGRGRARLLFVAHRAEILQQALATFRHALRDPAFGELWVAGERARHFEHVFASIQSLHQADLDHLAPDHFDVVVVDEFHHAAAPSYRRLLAHLQPTELLGLTATPERGDGTRVQDEWFGGRIAAELRLWDAIDQQRLVPFAWFGLSDGIDLRDVPWRRGHGYDVDGLSQVLTADDAYARRVLQQLQQHVADLGAIRALGFCVSVAHAQFMARVLRAAGVAAVAIAGTDTAAAREQALRDLRDGRVQVVFSVDLFNEGLDVPNVDTLLLLRPTESGLLFQQQLGRGLRRADGKHLCTVLDFVGNHRREFRFDRRLQALLKGNRREIEAQIVQGLPFLPAGCHMELDAVAREVVLRSLRDSVSTRWADKVRDLRAMLGDGRPACMQAFLAESGLDLDDVYAGGRCWSELCEDSGVPIAAPGRYEAELRRALGRMLHIDDPVRISGYRTLLAAPAPPDPRALPESERRLLRMLVASVVGQVVGKDANLHDGCTLLWQHPQIRSELQELLAVLGQRRSHLQTPLTTHPEVPLQVHARYTRAELLAAFEGGDRARVPPWQTGVHYVKQSRTDVLAFTLDKTDGRFSPTTRYRDHAVSRERIHWESQSVTRADSDTGRRYRGHVAAGSHVVLFARESTATTAFWCLGPATYVEHHGERPMAITWQLSVPLPGDLFVAFAAAVA